MIDDDDDDDEDDDVDDDRRVALGECDKQSSTSRRCNTLLVRARKST